MAKVLKYVDDRGVEYPTAYFRLVQLNLGIADRTGMATFYGYKDQASRAAGKQSIGSKSYSISGQQFDQLMQEHLTPGGPNVMQLAYKIANETKDVPAPTPEDPNRKVGFFEGAEDLL